MTNRYAPITPPWKRPTAGVLLAAFFCVLGCAPALHQRVGPYPGYGQSFQQLQRDSAECDAWARSLAGSASDSTLGGAAGGAALGAASGAALGAISGAFLGDAGSGAAIGAALGAASGGMQGAASGAVAYDQSLLVSYQNCMAARGYVVNGATIQPPAPSGTREDASADASDIPAVAAPAEHHDVETRMIRLRELHQDGLITDKEYRDRRRAILDDL